MLNIQLLEPKPQPDDAPISRPTTLTSEERRQGLAAAARAKRDYPGPVGLILHDAIKAYLEFGYKTDQCSAVPQLLAELGVTTDHI